VTKLEAAMKLAHTHLAVEPNLEVVYLIQPLESGDINVPIKLLEVVRGAIENGIQPISFAPSGGIHYPSVIVEMSPAEFQKMLRPNSRLRLPKNWTLGKELARRKPTNAPQRPTVGRSVR
jgi:hypothetical protein